MRKMLIISLMVLSPAVTLAATTGAGADLGDKGTFVPFGSVSLDYSTAGGTATIGATLAPGVLYFVIDNLAVGGNIVLGVDKPENTDATTRFGIGPSVAYHLKFSPALSLLPQASLDFMRVGYGGNGSPTDTTFTFRLFAPVLYRVSHFFLGVGPYFDAEIYNSRSVGNFSSSPDKTVAIGIRTTIGGWL